MMMTKPTEPLYFAHISDTHIGPTREYGRHGFQSYPNAARLVEVLNSLPQPPDLIVHTGDVVTDPSPAAYGLAADLFARLTAPIYFVNGNHDTALDIRKYLPMGPQQSLSERADRLTYAIERKGYRFLVLDGRGPDAIDPHGVLDEAQLQLVEQEATAEGPPLALFVHFPSLPLNSIWMDDNMLLLNGEELHRRLLPARNRLRGVFYGHVHQSMQTIRDGITYIAVPSAFAQFSAWPQETEVGMDPDYLPGFNFVHMLPNQTIIHQHTFHRS